MSEQIIISTWVHICKRCNYIWCSQVEKPVSCCKCRSTLWNKTRELNRKKGLAKDRSSDFKGFFNDNAVIGGIN